MTDTDESKTSHMTPEQAQEHLWKTKVGEGLTSLLKSVDLIHQRLQTFDNRLTYVEQELRAETVRRQILEQNQGSQQTRAEEQKALGTGPKPLS